MNQRWADEHGARGAPQGLVLYDADDNLITVKTGPNEWTVYSRDGYHCDPLRDSDIDGDRGDELVGVIDRFATP